MDDPALVPAARRTVAVDGTRARCRRCSATNSASRPSPPPARTTSSSRRATCTRRTASGRWTSAGTSRAAASPSCSASRSWAPTRSCARSAGARSPSRRSRRSTRRSASYYEAYADGVNAYLADHDGRRCVARVRRPRPAEPRLRDRAVDAGRLGRVAEGDGLGPPLQHRGRDRAGAARAADFTSEQIDRALPGLSVRPQSGHRADDLHRSRPASARRRPHAETVCARPRSSGRRSTASSRR